jgi:flagellar motor protein MotB
MLINNKNKTISTITPDGDTNFWPGFIDVFVSVLMIFFLISFLRLVINTEAFEILKVKSYQEQFAQEFASEFEDEIKQGKIKIITRGNLQQITFSSEVLFNSGEAQLLRRGKRLLGRLAFILGDVEQRAKFKQIQIEGHTDNVPIKGNLKKRFHSNWELSAQRAINVVIYFHGFIDDDIIGLKRKLFSGTGYADLRPVAPNTTKEGKALNRRIEIRMVYFGDFKDDQ